MKIKQVEILSNNLIETEKFYSETLGFKIHQKKDNSISFVTGNSILVFRKTENLKPIYHFAFNIPTNKLYEAEKWISSKISMIKFENKQIINFPNWNAKSLYFFDNNGNILEFIARFSLLNESQKEFDSFSVLSISEIAFVTENVVELSQKLITENNFNYFPKQVQRNDFSVIGGENGLLIIVDSERNWFPTHLKAEVFWTKILIENDGSLINLVNE